MYIINVKSRGQSFEAKLRAIMEEKRTWEENADCRNTQMKAPLDEYYLGCNIHTLLFPWNSQLVLS